MHECMYRLSRYRVLSTSVYVLLLLLVCNNFASSIFATKLSCRFQEQRSPDSRGVQTENARPDTGEQPENARPDTDPRAKGRTTQPGARGRPRRKPRKPLTNKQKTARLPPGGPPGSEESRGTDNICKLLNSSTGLYVQNTWKTFEQK